MPRGSYKLLTPETRQRIWEQHTNKETKPSMGAIARAEKLAKSTVHSVIQAKKRELAGHVPKKSGRKSKLPKACVLWPNNPRFSCNF